MFSPPAGRPQIILYDLACTKGVCFDPAVWRVRLALNYKRIPYRTIFLEFPDVRPTFYALGLVSSTEEAYEAPAIHYLPSDEYLMGSSRIIDFLEYKYAWPSLPAPSQSEAIRRIETQVRSYLDTIFELSILPRIINILSPRSRTYHRHAAEKRYDFPIEELLDDEEETHWRMLEGGMREISGLLQAKKAVGPYVLGGHVSLTDFMIAGYMQSARTIDEAVYERIARFPGFAQIYDACAAFMEQKD
ncbi:hypothetical protein N7456_000639 [Penicillium angulare]|uniref:GST N-terminal domain-containing protein n=1 Tax=Penicillium angulare TaxID=116970 RepID=A0A9W9GCI3_9EURO|nr:hypothetical protein N7456_000639 [Penicillium angulare]